jgi:hypothetical protein
VRFRWFLLPIVTGILRNVATDVPMDQAMKMVMECHGGVSRVTTGCAGEGSRNKGQKLDHG